MVSRSKFVHFFVKNFIIILLAKVVNIFGYAGLVSELKNILPKLEPTNNSFTDVRYNVGDAAFLPCHVVHADEEVDTGDGNITSVSWIRRRDWQILSAGVYTYTIDDRFAILHQEGSGDWTLQLKFVKLSDNGTYECQIHTDTETGFTSKFVNLHVYQPKAIIAGTEDLHVSTGHSFTLTCHIEQQVISPPMYVMWLHQGIPLNYAPDKPRLTVVTQKGVPASSTLRIVNARYSDSGNYTCTSPNSASAYTIVYVSEGDNAAAIQRIESFQPSHYEAPIRLSYMLIIFSIITLLNLLPFNLLYSISVHETVR